jgi:hypothetical protein
MTPKSTRILFFLFFLSLALINSSCTPGKRTAQNFVARSNQVSIMLIPPTSFLLYHYPYEDTGKEPENLSESQLLAGVDTARSMEIFNESIRQELLNLNLNVFEPENFDSFLQQQGPKYIFAIAQAEIIETDRIFTDRAFVDTIIYRQDFLLRVIEQNTWFEFVKVDDPQEESAMKVLYSSFDVADRINGRFRYNRNWEVYYEYQSEMLTREDVYNLNRFAGRRNGRYIYEFLLNLYVEEKRGPRNTDRYFKYSPSAGNVYTSRDDYRFIILDPEEILIED